MTKSRSEPLDELRTFVAEHRLDLRAFPFQQVLDALILELKPEPEPEPKLSKQLHLPSTGAQ